MESEVMRKVAIVGVEGSGKTVMLSGLGELYSHPDEGGYFLSPTNFATANYVTDKIQRMRRGEWPSATAGDEMQGLNWMLKRRVEGRRPADICEVSFLDFAGEVYRTAFGIRQGAASTELAAEAVSLTKYIREADELIVLINLRDVIVKGRGDPRVEEAMWITNEILSFALDEAVGRRPTRAAIVISQADSYQATIESCGGPAGVLRRYLPHVANNYDWLDVFTASAVDKCILDDGGNSVPAPDFQATGLKPIMDWIRLGARPAPASRANVPTEGKAQEVQAKPSGKCTLAGGFFSALFKPFNYAGRACCTEYLSYIVGMTLVFMGLAMCAGNFGDWALPIVGGALLYMMVPLLSLLVRRGHDLGLPGVAVLLPLILLGCLTYGIGTAVGILVLGLVPGRRLPNKYGDPINVK